MAAEGMAKDGGALPPTKHPDDEDFESGEGDSSPGGGVGGSDERPPPPPPGLRRQWKRPRAEVHVAEGGALHHLRVRHLEGYTTDMLALKRLPIAVRPQRASRPRPA